MKKITKKQKIIILVSIITIVIVIGIVIGANTIKISIANEKYNSSNSDSSNGNLLPEYIKKGITLGGITGTLESLDTSDATATPEDISYGKTAYVDGKKITGLFVPKNNLKIGDFVYYKPDQADAYSVQAVHSGYGSNQSITQEDLKWQIFSINDDGTIDLISENSTNQTFSLRETAVAYNNVVFLLNDMCNKLYSNKSLGIEGRSIKREDIEKHLSEKGIQEVYNFTFKGLKYGGQKTYYTYIYYPVLYALENGSGINTTSVKKDGIGVSDSYYTEPTTATYARASSSLTGTLTTFQVANSEDNFVSATSYNMIQNNETYWIATRVASPDDTGINWGVLKSSVNGIGWGLQPFGSANQGPGGTASYGIRPIVAIPSGVKLYGGDGTADYPYQLIK